MDKFIKQLHVEVDTAFLYRKVAAVQKDQIGRAHV